jgi:hypothetical protein
MGGFRAFATCDSIPYAHTKGRRPMSLNKNKLAICLGVLSGLAALFVTGSVSLIASFPEAQFQSNILSLHPLWLQASPSNSKPTGILSYAGSTPGLGVLQFAVEKSKSLLGHSAPASLKLNSQQTACAHGLQSLRRTASLRMRMHS